MRRLLLALLLPLGTVILPDGVSAETSPLHEAVRLPHIAAMSPQARLAREAHVTLVRMAHRLHVTPTALRQQWQHVAQCEVAGNWHMRGPIYSGIGFLNSTWAGYGGKHFARIAGEATIEEQILVGMHVTGGWVPDQYGCNPTGW
jgi:hypothetical protein